MRRFVTLSRVEFAALLLRLGCCKSKCNATCYFFHIFSHSTHLEVSGFIIGIIHKLRHSLRLQQISTLSLQNTYLIAYRI